MTADVMPVTDESLDDMMAAGRATGPKHYFGGIAQLDVWDCVLEKGRGKVPFDPTFHAAERRNVAITLEIVCTARDGSTYSLKQSDIANNEKFKITLESLKALGISGRSQLAALTGQHAQVVRVDTGGKYQAKKDSADGKIRAGDWIPEQALRVLALYPNADAARTAEMAHYARRDAAPTGDGRNVPQPIDAATIDPAARDALLKAVPMLWQAAAQNPVTFAAMLGANAQFAAYGLTPDAPEVLAATGRDASVAF